MGVLRLFDPARYPEIIMAFCDYPEMARMLMFQEAAANADLNPSEAAADGNNTAFGGGNSSEADTVPACTIPQPSTLGSSLSTQKLTAKP